MKERLLLLPFALFLIILPFPGTIAVRMLTLTLAFFIAWRIWWVQRPHNEPLPGKRVIGFWVVVCLLSLTYAVDPVYSLKEMKSELLNSLTAFFAFFVIAGNPARARYLVRALAVGLIIIGGWAAIAWVVNGFSWDESGRYGGIGIFASYLIGILPAMVWLANSETTPFWRRTALALLPFILLLAFATGQRAVWPTLAVEIFLCWFILVDLGKLPQPRLTWVQALLVVAALAASAMFLSDQHRFQEKSGDMMSDTRLAFWPSVVENIAEHPMSGGGFGRRAMAKAYPYLIPEYNTQLWHGHNIFLNYGLSMGLPGMLAIALVFGFWARYFWQAIRHRHSPAGMVGLVLVIGVLLRNQFNDFFVRDMSLLFWAQIGLFARLTLHPQETPHAQQSTT